MLQEFTVEGSTALPPKSFSVYWSGMRHYWMGFSTHNIWIDIIRWENRSAENVQHLPIIVIQNNINCMQLCKYQGIYLQAKKTPGCFWHCMNCVHTLFFHSQKKLPGCFRQWQTTFHGMQRDDQNSRFIFNRLRNGGLWMTSDGTKPYKTEIQWHHKNQQLLFKN